MMAISVVLCTYNRCQSLAKALGSIAAQTLSESTGWEVLVVDNNSTDQTREVITDFCRRYPARFRYLFEGHQGKSYALNAGVREARGDILAFMDDDVIVEPDWLQNLAEPLLHRGYAGAGGCILLEPSFSPPPWLPLDGPSNVGGALALFNRGDEAKDLSEPPFGTNMAFRRAMFDKYGGFRTDLGPCPGSQIRSEDTEFGRRLLAAGERLRYQPLAVVYHSVPENRIRQSYLLAWYFDFGRAMVREWRRGPAIFGIPRRCFTFIKIAASVLPVQTLRWVVAWNPKRRFFCKCWLKVAVGQLSEIYRQWRKAGGEQSIRRGCVE